jgi:DNA polymerase-3 subunit beta
MKFTCLQENLAKGVSMVSKAISVKSPLPVLANILFVTENGQLRLSATDLETVISTTIGASIDEEGSITVPSRLLSEFLSNLSPGTLNVVLKKDTLHLSSSLAKSKFSGINASEFPDLPNIPCT